MMNTSMVSKTNGFLPAGSAGNRADLQALAPQFGKIDGPVAPPATDLKLKEWPKAIASMGKLNLAWLPLMASTPKGDGHPVIVLPGFMTGDATTYALRKFLSKKNYDVHTLSLGLNIPINQRYSPDELVAKVIDVYNKTGQKVSLVGWSMGGLQAREIAKRVPNMVRDVVTMGSPIGVSIHQDGVNESTQKMFERLESLNGLINPTNIDQQDLSYIDRLHEAPPVPVSAIYSKDDGVASWKICLQESEHKNSGAPSENIEVTSSHFGMGHDPAVIYAVAERLAQPEGAWHPFDRQQNPLPFLLKYPKPVEV